MPANPVKGRDNVQQFIAGFTANRTATDWEVVHLVADGDVVFCERVDRTQFAEGCRLAMPWCVRDVPRKNQRVAGLLRSRHAHAGGAQGLVMPRPPATQRRAVVPLARSLFLPKVVAAAIARSAGLGGAAPRCEASGFPNLWLSRSSSALACSNAT